MNKEVEQLWQLQSVLSELREKEKQLSEKPEAFAAVDREYEAANVEMTKLEETIADLNKERRRVDGELQDQQELLRKYQGQLMQVKNQQQYAAAWKEIDSTRKHVKELEESELEYMGSIETAQTKLDERRDGFTALKTRHETEYEAWQHSLGDMRNEAAELKAKTVAIERQISAPLKREFYKLYDNKQHVAVSRVTNDSCGMCRVRVRPQAAQQLKRGEMIMCEGCRRILYLEKTS